MHVVVSLKAHQGAGQGRFCSPKGCPISTFNNSLSYFFYFTVWHEGVRKLAAALAEPKTANLDAIQAEPPDFGTKISISIKVDHRRIKIHKTECKTMDFVDASR